MHKFYGHTLPNRFCALPSADPPNVCHEIAYNWHRLPAQLLTETVAACMASACSIEPTVIGKVCNKTLLRSLEAIEYSPSEPADCMHADTATLVARYAFISCLMLILLNIPSSLNSLLHHELHSRHVALTYRLNITESQAICRSDGYLRSTRENVLYPFVVLKKF